MGYSCTTAAHKTLDAIIQHSGSPPSNTWVHENGSAYFYEICKENQDGAITGSVYKISALNKCSRSGSFRINPNGSVERFHCLNKAMRNYTKSLKSDF